MKNKLFLALALAGAVACKKDNTPTPSPNTNDVNAQVTNFIDKLDLTKDLATQVEAFAKTLKNDTEMEKLLVGSARASAGWNLVPFETVKVYETEKRTLDGAFILNKSDNKDYTFEDYRMLVSDYKPLYFLTPHDFKMLFQENNENNWTIYNGVYYTNQGLLILHYAKKCKFSNTQSAVEYFVESSYENITTNNESSISQKIKDLNTFFNEEPLCYESFTTNVNQVTVVFGDTKNFIDQQDEETETVLLKSQTSSKIKTYKRSYTFKKNVKYKAN